MALSQKDILLFELAERVARLLSHVQLSRQIASRHALRLGAQDAAAKNIEKSLFNSFVVLRRAALQPESNEENAVHALMDVKCFIDGLHMQLLQYIPRPYEPVELLSFLRQANKQSDYPQDSPIFASEQLYNSCFGIDLIGRMSERLEQLADDLSDPSFNNLEHRTLSLEGRAVTTERKSEGYISIPRVDLNNPCSWPSLIHELHHQKNEDTGLSLREELKARLGDEAYENLLSSCRAWMFPNEGADVGIDECLGHWLLECWCDCAGIKVLGPSIWFSQIYAFLFNVHYLSQVRPFVPKTHTSYPPAFLRLKILRSVLNHRYHVLDREVRDRIFSRIDELYRALLGVYCPTIGDMRNAPAVHIHAVIADFLASKLQSNNLRGSEDISFSELENLVDALDSGEPIPTVGPDPFTDRKASIGEILLAGWLNRLGRHREKVLEILGDEKRADEKGFESLQRCVDRFDESLKRSIQVAEWIDFFRSSSVSDGYSSAGLTSSALNVATPAALLSGSHIRDALRLRDLRIVPLINPKLQISPTSVDVRLGHNFEIFFPDVRSVIDLVGGPSEFVDERPESMDVQIDFAGGITIHPGQFVLAHTLEYLRLPSNIAAQIEGRSSFARLGLQVHMTANLVEAGFEGSLTLEIANVGPSAIKLYPGTRIGQLRFFGISPAPSVSPLAQQLVPKYQGMLSQNKTRQSIDPEVEQLKEHRRKDRGTGGEREHNIINMG